MDLKDIKRLVELIKENELTEFKLEKEDFKISVRREGNGENVVIHNPPVVMPGPAHLPVTQHPAAAPVADGPAAEPVGESIKSPMVGTFYRSSSPEVEPFISVGQAVEADTVVCIVEAMKVMNEIKAERTGVIKKILVEDATPVEYDQPLFEIE